MFIGVPAQISVSGVCENSRWVALGGKSQYKNSTEKVDTPLRERPALHCCSGLPTTIGLGAPIPRGFVLKFERVFLKLSLAQFPGLSELPFPSAKRGQLRKTCTNWIDGISTCV